MKKDYKIQIIVILVLILILLCLIFAYVSQKDNKKSNDMSNNKIEMNGENTNSNSSTNAETSGAIEVTDTQTLTGNYETSNQDESAIKVSDGGNLTLQTATINKTGDSTNTENSEFYGVNAGILTTEGSTTTITDSEITTDAKGANAVFATGEDAKVYVYNTTITTTGESSARGLDATYGGYIEAENVTISTVGGSCATLATDRGEGTVIARNSKLSTAGSGSPIIYSTGDITLEDSEGTATGAQICVVEGKNTATVTDSVLSCSGKGNRNDVDNAAIMIYQSMSGDAGEGTGTFNATNSTLEILESSDYYNTAPFFFITNTEAVINLENNTIKYGSGILLSVKGTDEWGNSGQNGGDVELNATNQNLVGDIEADNISTVEIELENGSSFEGTINGENTAKSIKIELDKSSTITLTGDSYVTSLDDEDESYSNINFNGYTLYVNGVAIN